MTFFFLQGQPMDLAMYHICNQNLRKIQSCFLSTQNCNKLDWQMLVKKLKPAHVGKYFIWFISSSHLLHCFTWENINIYLGFRNFMPVDLLFLAAIAALYLIISFGGSICQSVSNEFRRVGKDFKGHGMIMFKY